jgi:hypothetical protein
MNSVSQQYLYEYIHIVSVCSIKVMLYGYILLLFLLLLLLVVVVVVVSSLLSPLCIVFMIVYLKQTMFLGYIVLQLFCIYNFWYI